MPRRDFTMDVYCDLLVQLKESGYAFARLKDYAGSEDHGTHTVILRHDVDKNPMNAMRMALLENKLDIHASYYFRYRRNGFERDEILQIAALGHEIGYHYEDLSTSGGDPAMAIQLFRQHLGELRRMYDVRTICMHGSPLSKWNNLDLWKHYDYRDFGILCEPYIDLDFTKIAYLTDTGRTWANAGISFRDKVESHVRLNARATFDIIEKAGNGKSPKLMLINTHPQRWHNRLIPWAIEYVSQKLKNLVKRVVISQKP